MIAFTRKDSFWHITLRDILILLCAVAVPVAIGIYTAITNRQQEDHADQAQQFELKPSIEMRQKTLHDNFLTDIYILDKDGYLEEQINPWAYANAYYRAVHGRCDTVRRGDILQFLKEKQLIGRTDCAAQCRQKKLDDIIHLTELSFDDINPRSQTGRLNKLNIQCVVFDQVSMMNAQFVFTSLDGASFDRGRLKNIRFIDTSLVCVSFTGADLEGAWFENCSLDDADFRNADLQGACNDKLGE
jgi:hypothetical protein